MEGNDVETRAGGDHGQVTAMKRKGVLPLVLLAAVVALPLAAFVGKASAPSGSCLVTPNPVAVGGQYTINGTGLPKSSVVDIWVTDSSGTQIWASPTDSNGDLVPARTVASVSGGTDVKLTTRPGPPGEGIGNVDAGDAITLATCSFSTP